MYKQSKQKIIRMYSICLYTLLCTAVYMSKNNKTLNIFFLTLTNKERKKLSEYITKRKVESV